MEEIMKEGERKRKKERSGGKDGKRVSKQYTCAYLLFFSLSLSQSDVKSSADYISEQSDCLNQQFMELFHSDMSTTVQQMVGIC